MLFLTRAVRATKCFLPDQKILTVAKVITVSNSGNTYNYIAAAQFNRNYITILNFEATNISPPIVAELET